MAHNNSHQNPSQQEQIISKAVGRAADSWQVSNVQLARILGLSEASISRLKSGRFYLMEESKTWQLALLFLRGFRGLDAYMGGHAGNERLWLNAYNSALGGVPARLMEDVAGLAHVVQYIDAMRGH